MHPQATSLPDFRICVADADAAHRALFRDVARSLGDCAIVAECREGVEALAVIRDLAPDVVIADARLARIDGFGLLREAGATGRPAFVLTTSEESDALRAFAASAIDCMIRPLEPARCRAAVRRARRHIAQLNAIAMGSQLAALLAQCTSAAADAAREPHLSRVVVAMGQRSVVIPAASIEWIGAEDCYSRVYAWGTSYLVRQTLGVFERRLDTMRFIRPHRSAIVNIECICEIQHPSDAPTMLVLTSGARIPVSQRRQHLIAMRLGGRARRSDLSSIRPFQSPFVEPEL